jgi:hypothetical protein
MTLDCVSVMKGIHSMTSETPFVDKETHSVIKERLRAVMDCVFILAEHPSVPMAAVFITKPPQSMMTGPPALTMDEAASPRKGIASARKAGS